MARVPWEPVPGGLPDPVAAATVFSPEEIERAEHFSRWARAWSWSSLVASLAVACWLGFGRRGRALAEVMRGPWWLRIVLVVTALTLIGRVVTLPFGIALRQLRLDEGLAAGSWTAWSIDLAKGELVAIASTSIALVALVGCARRWPRAWPAVAGAGLAALVVVGSFGYPLVVEPLFNRFEPLQEGALRTAVLELAEKEGVAVDDVLVADASRRTTTLNAYVSGFGHTRRVVLYDNLVQDTPEDEALSVVAHELAHAKHGDVVTGTALGAAGAFVGIGLLGVLLPGRGRRVGGNRPIAGVADIRSVPPVLALAAIAMLLSAPAQSAVSRQLELRADQTALEATKSPEAFVGLQRRLALRSQADPTPPAWSQWWFGSHPTVLERIALAQR
ncbi:M48 family metallopeptidase [Nocardioides sp.]|nr:M48 family metallopeptidase [Nocardioides sp.]